MGYLYKPPPPIEDKYLVKWSFHAGKWWAGELIRKEFTYRIDNVVYHPSWRNAMEDIKGRILENGRG